MKKRIMIGIMLMGILISQSSCSSVKESAEKPLSQTDNGIIVDEPAPETGDILDEDEIKAIVLQQASGSIESDIIMLECEYDDGECQYEGKVYNNGHIYEFEISGENGNILEWEIEVHPKS